MAGENTDPGLNGDPNIPNNGLKTNIAVWCLFIVATVFILLRLYSKGRRPRRGFWWDDYVLVLAWTCQLASAVQISIMIANGFGMPGKYIDAEHSYRVGLGGLVAGTMMILATTGSKTSFILTLVRISTGQQLTVALFIAAVSMNLFHVATIVIQWTQCRPLEKTWHRIPSGSCLPSRVNLGMAMASTAYSGIIDLSLAIASWFIVSNLQIRKNERVGIALVMSMDILNPSKLSYLDSVVLTWFHMHKDEGANLIILSSTEITFTIMAASLPMLRTLVREFDGCKPKGSAQGPGRFEELQLQRRTPGEVGRDNCQED
ncbi:hypothetical protein PspLS_10784 [Pyricularia sp. CBS 133598]|nr:hypothetical protein PspLS_10784 [Pyricularia sp. CBS 133598]